MRFKLFAAALVALSASIAHADTSTFDFTYASTTGGLPGETATGSGSFTVFYDAGSRSATLTAFSFTDTIDSSDGDSTYTYKLTSGTSSSFVLTLGGGIVRATIDPGSDIGTVAPIGPVSFSFGDNAGVITESTSGGTIAPESNAGNTSGSGTLTLVSQTFVTPEPSSMLLCGTGVCSLIGLIKRRFA